MKNNIIGESMIFLGLILLVLVILYFTNVISFGKKKSKSSTMNSLSSSATGFPSCSPDYKDIRTIHPDSDHASDSAAASTICSQFLGAGEGTVRRPTCYYNGESVSKKYYVRKKNSKQAFICKENPGIIRGQYCIADNKLKCLVDD